MKPTCMIQLNSKQLAIAVGQMRKESIIEIHDMNKGKIVSSLKRHKDMIDSMLKLQIPLTQPQGNPYVSWFVSAGRDQMLVLWKLIDGKPMRRSLKNIP